jgi:hypothetical protein
VLGVIIIRYTLLEVVVVLVVVRLCHRGHQVIIDQKRTVEVVAELWPVVDLVYRLGKNLLLCYLL